MDAMNSEVRRPNRTYHHDETFMHIAFMLQFEIQALA